MFLNQFSLRLTFAIVVCLLAAGCSKDGPKRFDHWGKITYRGQPIPKGVMNFDPDLGAKNDGPQGFAEIVNGEYDTRKRPMTGPGSGKYVIRIFAADGVPGPEAPMGKPLFTSQVELSEDLKAQDGELNLVIPETAR